MQAVIYTPRDRPDWINEVATAVQLGAFRIERTEFRGVTANEIDSWLEACVPWGELTETACAALKRDLGELVALSSRVTGATKFTFRALTELPDSRCGFHVDTVPPGSPTTAVLRVYCGGGTEYVDPDNVTSVRDFYRFLSRRERLVREGIQAGDGSALGRGQAELTALDSAAPFLARPWEVLVVPSGAVVCFKCVDVSRHWSDHPKSIAWIHRSPMEGERRFVVTISAAGRSLRSPRCR